MSLPSVTQLPVERKPQELSQDVTYYSAAPPPPEDEGLDLKRLIGAVRRRKYFILAVVLLLTGLAFLFIRQLTPIYEAKVTLLVEGDRTTVIQNTDVVIGRDPNLQMRETESAVLRSRQVAARVVQELNLTDNPLFNPVLIGEQPSILSSMFFRHFRPCSAATTRQKAAGGRRMRWPSAWSPRVRTRSP